MTRSFLGKYEAHDSPLHRLDPRIKIVMAAALIIGIVMTPYAAWPAYAWLWGVLAMLSVRGGLGLWGLSRRAGWALPFTLAALTLLFTTKGQPLVTIGGVTISEAGLARFIAIVLKSWLAAQPALLLAITTPFPDLLWGLSQLRIPALLVEMIAFMYRYLFVLQEEAHQLMQARATRSAVVAGKRSGGTLLWRAQVTGNMVGNLFLRSYERSERVYLAMVARGYNGKLQPINRSPLSGYDMAQGTIPILLMLIIELISLVWWQL